MGSCFNSISFPGEISPAELQKKFKSHCEDKEYEYGHSSYNGTLSTTCGLKIESMTFGSQSEAEEYVSENTEKRGPSLAVRHKVVKKVTTKEPTFLGKPRSDRTAKTIAIFYEGGKLETVAADQLSKDEQEKVLALYSSLKLAQNSSSSLGNQLLGLTNRIHRVEEDFKDEDYKELKRVRRELKKAKAALESAKKKFTTLDERLGNKVWKIKTVDDGTTRWLVGGWAAE